VVDPVLLRGDPEYDLGRILWGRLDEIPDDREVRRCVAAFAQRAGVPDDRARAWVIVRSMSYLLWGVSRGLTEDPVRCRRLLDVFA
jgi:streptomycin 6-kinase